MILHNNTYSVMMSLVCLGEKGNEMLVQDLCREQWTRTLY